MRTNRERVLVTDTVTDPPDRDRGLVNEHEIIIEMQLISETNDNEATRPAPTLNRPWIEVYIATETRPGRACPCVVA